MDNRSDEPLADRIDLSWHPDAHIVREDTLGLTPARLRGIRESKGDLLVFVDDDNVLDVDFLEVALRTMERETVSRFLERAMPACIRAAATGVDASLLGKSRHPGIRPRCLV